MRLRNFNNKLAEHGILEEFLKVTQIQQIPQIPA